MSSLNQSCQALQIENSRPDPQNSMYHKQPKLLILMVRFPSAMRSLCSDGRGGKCEMDLLTQETEEVDCTSKKTRVLSNTRRLTCRCCAKPITNFSWYISEPGIETHSYEIFHICKPQVHTLKPIINMFAVERR
jgi:hypothetical protein